MEEGKLQVLIKSGRRVGNSTRLVDAYVQEVFDKGWAVIRDHDITDHKFIWNTFINRMHREHNRVLSNLTLDRDNYAIYIKEKKAEVMKALNKRGW